MPALLACDLPDFCESGLARLGPGAAWPSMYGGLGAGVSWVGLVSAIICLGTIASSVASVSVVRRLGTGKTSTVSVVMTAAGLMGFSLCTEFWQLCLWAVPYGLGAGAIDAALNSYVAIHYASRHMSWLHCMWGIGASAGPMIVARCLLGSTWNVGFRVLGVIQLVIAAVVAASLPFWNRVGEKVGEKSAGRAASDEDVRPSDASRRELLRVPGVRECLICFFCYCAFESTCGAWAASYCTLARGVSAGDAAAWASLFYVGITAGRAVSGFLTMRLNDGQLIRLGQALIAVGLALLLAPLPNAAAMVGTRGLRPGLRAHLPEHHPFHARELRRLQRAGAHGPPDGVCLRGLPGDVTPLRRASRGRLSRDLSLLPGRTSRRHGTHGRGREPRLPPRVTIAPSPPPCRGYDVTHKTDDQGVRMTADSNGAELSRGRLCKDRRACQPASGQGAGRPGRWRGA